MTGFSLKFQGFGEDNWEMKCAWMELWVLLAITVNHEMVMTLDPRLLCKLSGLRDMSDLLTFSSMLNV